jgi:hypothetical protein
MTVEYEITKDDVSAFNLYHNRHSPTARRQYLRSWFLPAALWLLICIGIGISQTVVAAHRCERFWICCRYSAWCRSIYCISRGRTAAKFARLWMAWWAKDGIVDCSVVTTSTISPENVTDSSEHRQSSTMWSGVERVAATDKHAYIYTSALAAIIVPARAFAGASEFEEFVRLAKGYTRRR